jgi:hypothetical protein
VLSLLTAAEMCAMNALFSACNCTSWSRTPTPPAVGEDAGDLLLVSSLFCPNPANGTVFGAAAASGDFLLPNAKPEPAAAGCGCLAPKLKEDAEDELEASPFALRSCAALNVGCGEEPAAVAEDAGGAADEEEEEEQEEEDFPSPPFISLHVHAGMQCSSRSVTVHASSFARGTLCRRQFTVGQTWLRTQRARLASPACQTSACGLRRRE